MALFNLAKLFIGKKALDATYFSVEIITHLQTKEIRHCNALYM